MTSVSIVVPIYCDPDAARRCIASIAAQSRRPDEVVLVDDRGPDGAFDAAIDEAEHHALACRTVRHECNRGVSAARNSGLRAASGQLIGFLDGDDEYDVDFVAELSDLLRDPYAGLAVCRTRYADARTSGSAVRIAEAAGCPAELDGDQYARLLLRDAEKGFATNKLYRRGLLPDDPFPDGRVYEDFQVVLAAALAAGRVAVSGRALYRYTVVDSSISRRFGVHLTDLLEQLADVRAIVGDRPGFDADLRIHRVGGIALPMANMALRAQHCSTDPQTRQLAAELIARARGALRVSDAVRLAGDGRLRLAVAAAMLKAAPRLYGRIMRAR